MVWCGRGFVFVLAAACGRGSATFLAFATQLVLEGGRSDSGHTWFRVPPLSLSLSRVPLVPRRLLCVSARVCVLGVAIFTRACVLGAAIFVGGLAAALRAAHPALPTAFRAPHCSDGR